MIPLTPYTFPDTDDSPDYLEYARKFVNEAINEIEPVQADVIQGYSDLMKEDYEKVIALQTKYPGSMHPELMDEVLWAYVMQGNYLSDEAETKDGAEADELFKQAGEKYAEAVKINSEDAGIYNGWGIMLLWWYRAVSSDKKENLLMEAKDVLLKAERIDEGRAAYNLACAHSLLGDDTECLKWLEMSKKVGRLPKREHLDDDKDLDPVREKQWFRDFIKDLP